MDGNDRQINRRKREELTSRCLLAPRCARLDGMDDQNHKLHKRDSELVILIVHLVLAPALAGAASRSSWSRQRSLSSSLFLSSSFLL